MKLLEEKRYTFNNVEIYVRINYRKKTISLIDNDGKGIGKRFLFANRQIEYITGWINVLKAMEFAMGEAKELLDEYIDTENKERENSIIELMEIDSEREEEYEQINK